ncbi:MAG: hypothetical protein ACXWCY_21415 [Burkholderiales bacterium]
MGASIAAGTVCRLGSVRDIGPFPDAEAETRMGVAGIEGLALGVGTGVDPA